MLGFEVVFILSSGLAISRLGNASLNVHQEVFQAGELVAKGECVMVKFDYKTSKSVALTEEEKELLTIHMVTD